jgi:hypothetical protein
VNGVRFGGRADPRQVSPEQLEIEALVSHDWHRADQAV